jgi:hypothetical protein
MKDWQYDVVFVVAIIGALVMLFGDPLGISVRPEVVTLFGVMLAFVYQQKHRDKDDKKAGKDNEKDKEESRDG